MKNPNIPKRRSIRLPDFDYAQNGAYFVTLCTQDRMHLFGEITDGKMAFNAAGEMVHRAWMKIPEFYSGYHVEAVQVMPNHIHGILMILDANRRTQNGRTQWSAPTRPLEIGEVVKRFKMISTKRYTEGVKNDGWPSFNKRLWQRNYWEHVIRNDSEMNAYREYILNNPLRWELDELNKPVK